MKTGFRDMDLLRIRVMVRQSISKRFAVWGLLRFTGTALSVILSEAAKRFGGAVSLFCVIVGYGNK